MKKKLGMIMLIAVVLMCGVFAVIVYATDVFVPETSVAESNVEKNAEVPATEPARDEQLPATEPTMQKAVEVPAEVSQPVGQLRVAVLPLVTTKAIPTAEFWPEMTAAVTEAVTTEATTTAVPTEAVTTEATTTAVPTEAATTAATVPTATTTVETTTTSAVSDPAVQLPMTELTPKTTETLPAAELPPETSAYMTDHWGNTHWLDENGKEPTPPDPTEEELVDQFIARIEETRLWYLDLIAEKEVLTVERKALLNGRSEDALTEDEKTRLAEIDDKLLEIWFHEPLDPDRYELETYVLNWLREDIPYYTCLLETSLKDYVGDPVAVRYRNIIEVSQKCLEMYDNGADIREIIGYRLMQTR